MKYKVLISISVLLVVFGFILYGVVRDRSNEFFGKQEAIALVVTDKVANEVQEIFTYKKKLVKAFLEDHKALLLKITDDLENDEIYDEFNAKLQRYFYDYFSSSIASDKGELLRFTFGDIGEICIVDMQTYLETGKQKIRIHPNATLYHYDILVHFMLKGKKYLFICTFTSDEIASLLNASAPLDHNLFIVNKDKDFLIEVTKKGSRSALDRQGEFSLSENEQKHILASKKIEGTFWHVLDSYDCSYFDRQEEALIKDYVMVFVVFAVIMIFMGMFVLHNIKKKVEVTDLNKNLERLSFTDALTGLHNRHYLDKEIEHKWNEASRLNQTLSIAMIDIDFFKQYNDFYGHVEGDKCLNQVAQICKQDFRRANEFCIRYGGEEFMVVNLGDEEDKLLRHIEVFIKHISQNNIDHASSEIGDKLTVSVGLATTEKREYEQSKDLIKAADDALYKAKSLGRNQISVAT